MQQNQKRMIIKTVFGTSSKPLLSKPEYVKPVYKTYRQLLELDKPKKIIHIESDDENDDFLEKLLKNEEKKEKQKQRQKQMEKKLLKQKQNTKSSATSNDKKSVSRPVSPEKKVNTPHSQKSMVKSIQFEKAANNPSQLQSKSIEPFVSGKLEAQLKEQLQKNKQNKVNPNPQTQQAHNTSSATKRLTFIRNTSSKFTIKSSQKLNSKFQQESGPLKSIYIDNDNLSKIRYSLGDLQTVKYNWPLAKSIKKSQGITLLQKIVHQDKPHCAPQQSGKNNSNKTKTETKINHENKTITHSIASPLKRVQTDSKKKYSQKMNALLWKNACTDPAALLNLNSFRQNNLSKTDRPTRRLSSRGLFQSSYQQNLFLRSLKKK